YLGNGGTHKVPFAAYSSIGIWQRTMDIQAGDESVFSVHCNSHGCGKWNSGYELFELDSSAGGDTVSYQPTTSALQMNMRGTGYTFSPQAFTAGTINAGTVNATTLHGAVSAAQLPLFGASGTSHGPGAVPDPGSTAGSTRFLREDGTWVAPAGGTLNGAAGGDLSGSFPNPTVSAVHASSGTLDGVAIGGTSPASGSFSNLKATGISVAEPSPVTPFQLGTNNSDGSVRWQTQTIGGAHLGWIGVYNQSQSAYYGMCSDEEPIPNFIGLCGWYNGLGILGNAATGTAGAPLFGVNTSNQTGTGQHGVGGNMFGVNADSSVTTFNYVLDNGSGQIQPLSISTVGNVAAAKYHETLTTPASSSAACSAGDFADDANFHYVCTAANTWKRVALSTF
ncbi:MAG: hypothetical protein ACRD3K_08815, partial [Edaphobacter sp.]